MRPHGLQRLLQGYGAGAERDSGRDSRRPTASSLARIINKEVGAEEKFKEVSEAHEVFADVEKRAAYDQLGQQWKAGQNLWDAGFEFSGASSARPGGEFSDFFDTLFGGMRQGRQPSGGRAGSTHAAKTTMQRS